MVNEILDPTPYYYGSNIVYRGDMVYVNGVPYVSAAEYYRQAAELARSVEPIVVQESAPVQIVIQNGQPVLAPPEGGPANEAGNEVAVAQGQGSDWLPMGTFAVLRAGEDAEDAEVKNVIQLATNKTGQIRGNYFSEEGDDARQLVGAVDSKSQRVALRFADDEKTVMECGLWNLTQDSVPLLVHLNENDTEQVTLIRLSEEDEGEANSPATGDTP